MYPENTHHRGKYHCTAGLQFNKTEFDQKRKYETLFVCSEAVESSLVKLETSRTVILSPMVSVLWWIFTNTMLGLKLILAFQNWVKLIVWEEEKSVSYKESCNFWN